MNETDFPLLKETSYIGKVTACDEHGFIFQYNTSSYPMALFNIMMSEEGMAKACEILMQTNNVKIQIDRLATLRKITEVYVFTSDGLLQNYLIKGHFARIKLRNPEFKYYNEMNEMGFMNVSGELDFVKPIRDFDRSRANGFFFIQFFVIFLVVLFVILRKIIEKLI